jgi:hypothetical protein
VFPFSFIIAVSGGGRLLFDTVELYGVVLTKPLIGADPAED